MRQRLLSQRFAGLSSRSRQGQLSDSQREMVEAFQDRLETGKYRLVDERCPCGADDDVLIAEIDRYGLPLASVVCAECGAVRTNPYLDDASLDAFYREIYQAMYARAPQLDAYFANQFTYGARIAALYEHERRTPERILEVGCGAGGGLAAFQDRGHFVAGCDLSRDLVSFGTEKGLRRLWHGSIEDMPSELQSERWNVIFLHHVFEHVQSPTRTLRSLSDLLAPDGCILTIVPDILRVDRFPNPAGDALKFFHVAHKFNYTAECLEIIASQAGLTAAARVPPGHLKTAWSEMPELWMEFRRSGVASPPPYARTSCGEGVVSYLLETERRFLAGDFQKTFESRNRRERPPESKPRRLRRLWKWVAGHSSAR